MTDSELKIIHWNANGFRNHKLEFFQYLVDNKIHIACLNETKLNPNIRISHTDYHIIRLDKVNESISKGGVAIIVHKSVKFELMSSFDTEIVEALGLQLRLRGINLKVISVYFTGTSRDHDYDAYRRDIRRLTQYSNSIILGDLNSKHHSWGCLRSNRAGNTLYHEYCQNDFEICFPDQPTYFPGRPRLPSVLDIMLKTSSLAHEPLEVVDDLRSDHLPILLKINTFDQNFFNHNLFPNYSMTRWDIYQTKINDNLDLSNYQTSRLTCKQDIDNSVLEIETLIKNALNDSVPLTPRRRQENILTDEIKTRRVQIRLYQRNGFRHHKQAANFLQSRIRNLCDAAYNRSFQRYLDSIIPNEDHNKRLWKLTKVLKNKRSNIPPLTINNHILLTDYEKAEAIADKFLANHMTSIHQHTSNDLTNAIRRMNTNLLQIFKNNDHSTLSTVREVKNIISKLKNNKAPGLDGITNKALKHGGKKFSIALMYIFNACLIHCYFPDRWKLSIITPVPKPGKPSNDLASYRPISLLSCLGKIFERIILTRVQDYLDNHNILPNHQFGFRKGHSTTHQVKRVVVVYGTGVTHHRL